MSIQSLEITEQSVKRPSMAEVQKTKTGIGSIHTKLWCLYPSDCSIYLNEHNMGEARDYIYCSSDPEFQNISFGTSVSPKLLFCFHLCLPSDFFFLPPKRLVYLN